MSSVLPLTRRYRSLVWSFLDCDLPRTALFYAERYFHSEQSNHDARHLLSTCLVRCGQLHSAQHLVKDLSCSGCAELFAQCCMKLGRYTEGQNALRSCKSVQKDRPPPEPRASPDESVFACLAGTLALKANMRDAAEQHFLHALSLNPYVWEAVEGLCQLGRCPEIDQLLTYPSAANPPFLPLIPTAPIPHVRFTDNTITRATANHITTLGTGSGLFTPASNDHGKRPPQPFGNSQPNGLPYRLEALQPMNGKDPMALDHSLNGDGEHSGYSAASIQNSMPGLQAKMADDRTSHKRTRAQMASGSALPPKLEKKPSRTEGAFSVIRRSTRLLGGTSVAKNAVKAPSRERRRTRTRSHSRDPEGMEEDRPSSSGTSSAVHSPRDHSPGPPVPYPPDGSIHAQLNHGHPPPQDAAALATIFETMKQFARVVRALSIYEAEKAVELIQNLPDAQKMAPWVSAMVGRAKSEQAEYVQAARAFQQARDLDPYRMWDMDVYSTVLWHLQNEVHLSYLSQELVSIDDASPQAWIATGNCFSSQKDHGQALTCFRRATHLDPRCAYAFALCGHELLAMDDLEGASGWFRGALRVDERHYPAWYGLGMVYLKQNKARKAEYHFRRAIEISPHNAVLISCEGTALEKRGRLEEALDRFDRSLTLRPDSALVKFKRVKVLMSLKRFETALEDLLSLRDLAPEEANVAFVLGKLYREMDRGVDATRCFTEARHLDPKLSAVIAHLMEDMSGPG